MRELRRNRSDGKKEARPYVYEEECTRLSCVVPPGGLLCRPVLLKCRIRTSSAQLHKLDHFCNQEARMSHFLPYFPYPPVRDGFWSPVTATLNWCEEVSYRTLFL